MNPKWQLQIAMGCITYGPWRSHFLGWMNIHLPPMLRFTRGFLGFAPAINGTKDSPRKPSSFILRHTQIPKVRGVDSPFFSTIVLFNNRLFPLDFDGFLKRCGSLERMDMGKVPLEKSSGRALRIHVETRPNGEFFLFLFFSARRLVLVHPGELLGLGLDFVQLLLATL